MNEIEKRCLAVYEAWARAPMSMANGSDELMALFRTLVAAFPVECTEAFKRGTAAAQKKDEA